MKRALFLLSDRKDDLEFATEVSIHGGFELRAYSDLEEAYQALEPERFPQLFVDMSTPAHLEAFIQVFSPKLGKGRGKLDPNLVHLIGPEEISEIEALKGIELFGHYIARGFADVKLSGQHYARIAQQIVSTTSVGLTRHLSEEGVIRSFQVQHSDQKEESLERIDSFLRVDADVSSWLIPQVVNAVDELLMNAIYDAPLDQNGNQTHQSLARSSPVALDEHHAVEVEMGFDDDFVAISVTDQVGSLDKVKLVKHLFSGQSFDHFIVDPNMAGAGIGLSTTFRVGGSLLFINHPGERTEVTVFFPKAGSRKDFRKKLHFISIYIIS